MILVIEGFNIQNNENYQLSLAVRTKVFIEELQLDKYVEFDGKDNKAMHYIVLYDGQLAGYARWNETTSEIIIDRFCVLEHYRKKGIGHLFIKYILEEIIPSKKKINVYSTDSSTQFFIRNGFYINQEVKEIGGLSLNNLKL